MAELERVSENTKELRNLRIRVVCRDKYHYVCFDDKGRLFFPNHSKISLQAEEVATALEPAGMPVRSRCGCILFRNYWNSGWRDLLSCSSLECASLEIASYTGMKLGLLRNTVHQQRVDSLSNRVNDGIIHGLKLYGPSKKMMEHLKETGNLAVMESVDAQHEIRLYTDVFTKYVKENSTYMVKKYLCITIPNRWLTRVYPRRGLADKGSVLINAIPYNGGMLLLQLNMTLNHYSKLLVHRTSKFCDVDTWQNYKA